MVRGMAPLARRMRLLDRQPSGWRRRAGSNRRIAVLQTAPLATWVRRLVNADYNRIARSGSNLDDGNVLLRRSRLSGSFLRWGLRLSFVAIVPVVGGYGLPFLGHDLDLGQQRLHQLFRLHLPDQLAFFEQDPVAFPAGDADVGFLALADPVDDAAQHRHRQRHADMAEPLLDLIGQLDDVDLHAAAGRTGDDVHPAVTQFEGLQNLEADFDLFHRIGRQ